MPTDQKDQLSSQTNAPAVEENNASSQTVDSVVLMYTFCGLCLIVGGIQVALEGFSLGGTFLLACGVVFGGAGEIMRRRANAVSSAAAAHTTSMKRQFDLTAKSHLATTVLNEQMMEEEESLVAARPMVTLEKE